MKNLPAMWEIQVWFPGGEDPLEKGIEYSSILGASLGGSESKESACNVGETSLIPGSGRYPGEGNGYPHEYSCLENPWTEEPGEL